MNLLVRSSGACDGSAHHTFRWGAPGRML